MLISCAVTAQLISAFVFRYAKSIFSHDTAYVIMTSVSLLEDLLPVFELGQMHPALSLQFCVNFICLPMLHSDCLDAQANLHLHCSQSRSHGVATTAEEIRCVFDDI